MPSSGSNSTMCRWFFLLNLASTMAVIFQNRFRSKIAKIINYKHVFFFLVIITQMLAYNYPYILQIEPRNHHSFRQFDCLSFAQSFYNDRGTLMEPCLNNLGDNGNGKTASEFPIIQYFIGNLWKLTGVNTFTYRFLNLLFLFTGLFFVYKLFYEEFKNKVFAYLVSAFIFTSPILSYYGVSVLSDVQAFSLSLIGFYFFYSWTKSKEKIYFTLFLLFFLFAGLLKVSSAILYMICILYWLIGLVEEKRNGSNLRRLILNEFFN